MGNHQFVPSYKSKSSGISKVCKSHKDYVQVKKLWARQLLLIREYIFDSSGCTKVGGKDNEKLYIHLYIYIFIFISGTPSHSLFRARHPWSQWQTFPVKTTQKKREQSAQWPARQHLSKMNFRFPIRKCGGGRYSHTKQLVAPPPHCPRRSSARRPLLSRTALSPQWDLSRMPACAAGCGGTLPLAEGKLVKVTIPIDFFNCVQTTF